MCKCASKLFKLIIYEFLLKTQIIIFTVNSFDPDGQHHLIFLFVRFTKRLKKQLVFIIYLTKIEFKLIKNNKHLREMRSRRNCEKSVIKVSHIMSLICSIVLLFQSLPQFLALF